MNVDPIEYGRLISTVESLEKKVDTMEADLKTLIALANKSKGGFWMGMTIASFAGGFITWLSAQLGK